MFRTEKTCRDLTYEIDTLKARLEEANSNHRKTCIVIAGEICDNALDRRNLQTLLQFHNEEILKGEPFEIFASGSKSGMLKFLREKDFIHHLDTRYEREEGPVPSVDTYWLLKATPLFIKELTQLMAIHDIKE